MNAQEPYAYGTKINLMPGGRHELLTGYVVSNGNTGDGYRYHCLFPHDERVLWAYVYSEEIDHAVEVDEATTDRLMEATW
jgi:hypothetical protein